MNRFNLKIFFLAFCLQLPFSSANAANLADRLSGKILLQVESKGEAWYVNPVDGQRCYLGRPADALMVMRELGLGIKHAELASYSKTKYPSRLSGRIMLDVEKNGEAYYVYPGDLKSYYLGRPADAFEVMRKFGLGAANSLLAEIAENPKCRLVKSNESAGSVSINAAETAVVSYVIDGDTVELEDGRRVRYVGIDTPERDDNYYSEAREANQKLVLNKEVKLVRDISDKDKYGRLLRYIYINGTFVNEYLVRNGFARAYTYPPDVTYSSLLKSAQESAREDRQGIWKNYVISGSASSTGQMPDSTSYSCGSNSYDCSDFSSRALAQSVYDKCGGAANDIHKLDSNGDGEACESLP